MDIDELSQRLLLHIGAANYQPVKPSVILKQLHLTDDDKPALKKALKRLIKKGLILWGDKHLIRPVGAQPKGKAQQIKSNLITGVFRRAAKGYGFVRPHGAERGDRSGDIFIPESKTQDASNGDLVTVRIGRGDSRPRGGQDRGPAGEIVEILERDRNRFVGRYYEELGYGYVQVDGGAFSQPISVGDAGAKNAGPGDTVVVELVRFPTPAHEGEGVIVEVLGPRGAAGVDTLSIIHEFNLPGEFPEEVLDAAREQASRFDESLGERLDLTQTTTITIDPQDARDFDDAISLTRIENGHWRLGVHIADVTHFVRPNSALDAEARERATSVYLPDRVIPMLPEIISNNLASLQPNKVRYTKTCFIEFTSEGQFVSAEAHNTAIQSDRRFTYEEVDEYLADRAAWKEKVTPPVFELLGWMHELAMILRRRRFERGALELFLPEVKIDLDREGRVAGAHVVQNTESHQIIEEFMLAANMAVAELLAERELHFLRRVHEPPAARKMQALTTFVRELGFPAENLQSRYELQQLLQTVRDRPEERAINYAVLRSMQKAVYSPEEAGHFALASDNYCHFTSPIRRYPDMIIHRLLDAVIQGGRPHTEFDAMAVLGEHCSEREQRAESAERELVKVKLLNFLSAHVGAELDAVITGVEDFGLFAMGVELPAEGFIHVSALSDDTYSYDDRTHSLVGRRQGNAFRLGDLIRVQIAHVDVGRRQLDFRLLKTVGKAPPTPSLLTPPIAGKKRRKAEEAQETEGWQQSNRFTSGAKRQAAMQFGSGGGGPSRTYGGRRIRQGSEPSTAPGATPATPRKGKKKQSARPPEPRGVKRGKKTGRKTGKKKGKQ